VHIPDNRDPAKVNKSIRIPIVRAQQTICVEPFHLQTQGVPNFDTAAMKTQTMQQTKTQIMQT
jgi:hypothetical protein